MQATPSSLAERAQTLLAADTECLARLQELLREEQAALAARDSPRLDRAVQAKLDCLKRLERNEAERRALLRRAGMADWGAFLGSMAPALAPAWTELRGQLRKIAELTEANGLAVRRSQQSTARMLALLRGRTGEREGVYDRLGRTSDYGDNRPITSA